MLAQNSVPTVYLSYAAANRGEAERMRRLLEAIGVVVVSADSSVHAGERTLESVRSAIFSASVVFVLVGPKTRVSRWVDQEIALAIQASPSHAPAGLVAVILPEHEDYSRPYYDPENVPLRIHDHVSRESAILRKWTEDPAEIRRWIADAIRRRQRYPSPSVNFSTQSALGRFAWDESADQAALGHQS